ncbi:helix-turn-helix domain-containing protein [Paenibacillus polymyxa]|uniref:helix-turn-helix domain-containing protein n=1 Tax=Paenibacillus polymyxa TaxID=1406 RepID=UPI001ABA43A8|nr:helix-turn-helix transcriptional regulator [Paenibacillus polymyxa]MBO3283102.1 helix-turn-helix transcriptional regulator [Paenibacillus polymyxa]
MSNRALVCDLKNLLLEKGWEQKKLSELTGIREATISELVRNKNKMFPRQVLEKIINVLEIDDITKLIRIDYIPQGAEESTEPKKEDR